jgi:hypothetical protein
MEAQTGKLSGVPLFELKRVYVDGVEQERFRAVVEEGKSQAVAVVSHRYALVQMRDLFEQVLSLFPPDTEHSVYYYRGRGEMHLFPPGKEVGVAVVNSVDCSTAIRIHFLQRVNGDAVAYTPAREFYRIHVGAALQATLNAAEVLEKAEAAWEAIAGELSRTPVSPGLCGDLREALQEDYLREVVDRFDPAGDSRLVPPSVWSLLVELVRAVANRRYRSEVNRLNRMRQVSCLILAVALGGT